MCQLDANDLERVSRIGIAHEAGLSESVQVDWSEWISSEVVEFSE